MNVTSRTNWAWMLLLAGAPLLTGCAGLAERTASWRPRLPQSSTPASGGAIDDLSVARLHERQGNLGQAEVLYRRALQANPGNLAARHRLAVVLTRLDRHAQANEQFLQALERSPRNAELLSDFGYALYLQHDLPAAETALRQSLAQRPQDRRATTNLALVLGHQGRLEESYATFRQVVGEAEAEANLAYIHTQRGEGSQAVARYSKALSLDDDLQSAAQAMVQIAELQERADGGTSPRPPSATVAEQRPAFPAAAARPTAATEHRATPPIRPIPADMVSKADGRGAMTRTVSVGAADKKAPAPVQASDFERAVEITPGTDVAEKSLLYRLDAPSTADDRHSGRDDEWAEPHILER